MAIDDVFFSPNCFSPGNDNIKSSNNMINKTYTEDLFNTHVFIFWKGCLFIHSRNLDFNTKDKQITRTIHVESN